MIVQRWDYHFTIMYKSKSNEQADFPLNFIFLGYRLIIIQIVLVTIVACIFRNSGRELFSVLLGGSAWIIPSIYFVRKLFRKKTSYNIQGLFKKFFLGECIKLLLSAILIILIMLFFTVETKAFLSSYIAAHAASFLIFFWSSPARRVKQELQP
jgi:F0F1-type ATP synthase assembly protein I